MADLAQLPRRQVAMAKNTRAKFEAGGIENGLTMDQEVHVTKIEMHYAEKIEKKVKGTARRRGREQTGQDRVPIDGCRRLPGV